MSSLSAIHKHGIYQGGLLVPACAEWPGVIQPGTVTDVRCATVDYLPTISNLTGAKMKDKRPIDGIDLMPIIQGEQEERGKDLFFGFRRLFAGIDLTSVISGDYKLVMVTEKGHTDIALYDLKDDPYETADLKEQQPELFEQLKQRLAEMDASCRLSHEGGDFRYLRDCVSRRDAEGAGK